MACAYARPFVHAGCSVHDITAYDNLALKLQNPSKSLAKLASRRCIFLT
jgi:hypothetical protein